MKELRIALIATAVALASGIPGRASDESSPVPAQNEPVNQTDVPAQSTSAKDPNGTTTTKVNVDSQGIILQGYDVVAYFKQGKPVKGNATIRSTYQGATYLFSSSEDKADFDKDPAKYAPQYGAYCSYGVANGVLADLDGPEAFTIYKGKIYFCGNEGALDGFKTDIDANIEKADTNWPHLTAP
jgi:YHS domain-containing protein